MTCLNARRLWRNLCETTVGADCNGDELSQLTGLGLVALTQDLPVWPANINDRAKVALFLRNWADSIEDGS